MFKIDLKEVNDTNLKTAIPSITVILIIIGGAFLTITQALQNVDVSTVPEYFKQIMVFVQNTFGAGVVAVALIWLRNMWGYVEAYAQNKVLGNASLQYDVNKFYRTTAYYLGNLAIVFNVAPTPELRVVGTFIIFVIDILGSKASRILQKNSATPPQTVTPTS